MKKLDFNEVESAITNVDIINFENKFNIKLPENYKRLILKFNGGLPSYHSVYSDGEEISIGGFYSIKQGKILLEDAIKTFQVTEKLIPTDCIPMGYDGFGNPYCISINDEDYGGIYCWFLDMGEEEGRLMADFLEEFLGVDVI